jgi:phage gp29-like protein
MAQPPRLLDAYGRPVERKALAVRQAAAGVTGVRQVWAQSVAAGLTPARLASILRAADQGDITAYAQLAEEMEERDPHYASVLGVRKRAVSGVTPTVEPASEDKRDQEIAEAVQSHIAEHDGWSALVEDCLDAVAKGFSVVEIIWDTASTPWRPRGFEWVPGRFLTFDRETGQMLRLLDEADRQYGVELTPWKHIVHRSSVKSGHMARGGVARIAAFGWICKAYGLKDWMSFVETYGLPIRVGKYGPDATPEDIEKLFSAVANIGTDAAAVMPQAMQIEFQEASAGRGETVFENLLRYIDEQVSKLVLGQTMTSDDGSSQAQATVHNEVRLDIAQADARAVTGTLNRDLVRPFVDLNFGPQAAYPHLKIAIAEPEDTGLLLTHTAAMAAAGVRIRASEIRARLGYSEPDAGDEVIGGAPVPAAPGKDAPAKNSQDVALNAAAPDPFDALEAGMDDGWEPVMDETLRPILAAIGGAGSLEEVKRALDSLSALPSARLIDTLVQGAFKARAMGDDHD